MPPTLELPFIAAGVLVVLTLGYLLYGTFIARQYRLDDSRTTPAVLKNDGEDFIPTRPFYLLGQHFSAIAAAGPIAGPIFACMAFGWGPCLLWIVLGVILIGAVHDFSALIASVRHGAHSIAEIARETLGRRAWLALVCFIWLALLYVITAFTQITSSTFVGKAEELEGLSTTFNKGGAVAAASTLYLVLALLMGIVQRFLKPPMWLSTLIFVPATLGCIWLGTRIDDALVFGPKFWYAAILIYCLVASMLPMWLLQQPRGYLGGFVLYFAIAVGVMGVLFGGFEIRQPAWAVDADKLNPLAFLSPPAAPGEQAWPITNMLVPFLFVTIACGACSGFHGLICGGTTSKQIAKESHCKSIGFGAMLLEGFVAVIALATIMIVTPEQSRGAPPARIYGDGLALFLTRFLGPEAFLFCATFGAMAFSTFVFDTLDISTRLGRYLLQELFAAPGRIAGFLGAAATAGVPLLMLLFADPNAYRAFWTLFGTSNQLLAALTLLSITLWLKRSGRRYWYTLAPTVFVGSITVWALVIQCFMGARDVAAGAWRTGAGNLNATIPNGAVALALLGLAAVFVVEAVRAVRRAPA
ncbi:MAG: carbon starvation protein A [Phycisphaeraceae bacterium]|nr:carbon starvation protein A [Phycisphaeraceae bacterium]